MTVSGAFYGHSERGEKSGVTSHLEKAQKKPLIGPAQRLR